MKWSLHELASLNQPLRVDRKFDLRNRLVARDPDMILSASPFQVNASVKYSFRKAIIQAKVNGKLRVPSSRSLVPVTLRLKFPFREIYVASDYDLKMYEQEHPHDEETVLTAGRHGVIDFTRAVVDNVILQIPMQVLTPRERKHHIMPKGHGWSVISEAEYKHPKAKHNTVDPRLAKLKDYFN